MFYKIEISHSALAPQGVGIFVTIAQSSGQAPECLRFGDETIVFFLHKGSRRRKRLTIRVTREGRVEVLMPPRSSRKEALWAVASRGDWIVRHVRAALARPQAEALGYVNGEAHWFLGRSCVLDVATPTEASLRVGDSEMAAGVEMFHDVPLFEVAADAVNAETSRRSCPRVPKVQLAPSGDNRLLVRLACPTPAAVRKALLIWYRTEAQRIVAERLKVLCSQIPWLVAIPPWKVKTMRRRWGSCTIRGELTLNTHLVKAPLPCIDYVLLHEIAHIREHNHSKRYYAILEQLLPDWKQVRCELQTHASLFLNV